jgi:hypothetical protein
VVRTVRREAVVVRAVHRETRVRAVRREIRVRSDRRVTRTIRISSRSL